MLSLATKTTTRNSRGEIELAGLICRWRAGGIENGSDIVADAKRDTPLHVRCHGRKLIEVEPGGLGALVVGGKWLPG